MSVLDLFSLAGKRALVTGASRGLGRAMAEASGRRRRGRRVRELEAERRGRHGGRDSRARPAGVGCRTADLADRDDVHRLAADVERVSRDRSTSS